MLLTTRVCFALSLLLSSALAVPAPQPGDYTLKQTNRKDILARKTAPRRRASGVSYPECDFNFIYGAAVYEGSGSTSTGAYLGDANGSYTAEECLNRCRSAPGELYSSFEDVHMHLGTA